ncbi:hypothetical protein CHISP_3042 [Chitinispirillum alkaliphilum]|nr:hypothetical protein CHISP_3042 [Chitinispirillum alkaliphilum]
MKKSLYFDLACGASGDMILAALIDIGVPVEYLQENFNRIGSLGIRIDVERVKRQGIMASHLKLAWEKQNVYRHIHQIMDIIQNGGYHIDTVQRCAKVLEKIAEAEARVHGVEKEKVHFHEIGAVDTIIDILGVNLCLEYLGVSDIHFSQFTVGYGSVHTEHGIMPVPVPATAEMILGHAVRTLDIPAEILTPTGAGLLTALGTQALGGIDGIIEARGYGCGDKVFDNIPNIIRCFMVGREDKSGEAVDVVCEVVTDMDHISGEIMGHVGASLREMGVLDLVWIPLHMKKGRPGYRLSFLCRPKEREALVRYLMVNTRTLGVRYQLVKRVCAERGSSKASLGDNVVEEKICTIGDYQFSKPEYRSLAELSEKTNIPILELMEDYIRSKCLRPGK